MVLVSSQGGRTPPAENASSLTHFIHVALTVRTDQPVDDEEAVGHPSLLRDRRLPGELLKNAVAYLLH